MPVLRHFALGTLHCVRTGMKTASKKNSQSFAKWRRTGNLHTTQNFFHGIVLLVAMRLLFLHTDRLRRYHYDWS